MTFVQSIFSYLAFCIAFPFLATNKKIRRDFRRRFGFYNQGEVPKADGPTIWFHGASAGDITALHPTVVALRALEPKACIVVSSVTNSGYTTAQKLEADFNYITYQPYDIPGPVHRTLNAIQPHALVLEYTELWPQLIFACKNRGIPVFLHNGRFSAAGMGKYKLLFRLVGNLVSPLTKLLLRDEHEAGRARELGAQESQILVTGNTKFDNTGANLDSTKAAVLREHLGIKDGELVWVAGSTHEGEEELLLKVFSRLRQEFPALRMIIAPRYAHRGERIANIVKAQGFTCQLRSSKTKIPADVSVLNSVGELAACYALGTVVFVGGSFVSRGGQNILEPASWGRPVIFGPHMHNFPDAVKVLLGRGGLQAATAKQLEEIILRLLRQPEYRQKLGKLAVNQIQAIRGAAQRNAQEIAKGLKKNYTQPTT